MSSVIASAAADPASSQPARPAAQRWEPVGRFSLPEIKESSGVVKSRRHEGVFWTHNDSGNAAVLYAFRASGEIIAAIPVENGTNTDWEDIAADNDGHLYIGDTGNNVAVFAQRYIYRLREPDPFATPIKPVQVDATYVYRYDGPRFDAEGLFVVEGRLFVISKPRTGRAQVYRLEAADPAHPQTLTPKPVAELPLGAVTGADASADGRELAVCTCDKLELYRLQPEGVPVVEAPLGSVQFPCGQVEACGFDGKDVVLTAESGEIYRVTRVDVERRQQFR